MSRNRRDHDKYQPIDEHTDTENDLFADNSELIVSSRSLNRETSHVSRLIRMYQQRNPLQQLGGVVVFLVLFVILSRVLSPVGDSITSPQQTAGRNIRKGDTSDMMYDTFLPLHHSNSSNNNNNKDDQSIPSNVSTIDISSDSTKVVHTDSSAVHLVDHGNLEDEMIRGKSKQCSWWKSNQSSILQHINQVMGDILNHVLSLNFEYSKNRKNYVMQLEKVRSAMLKRPKMRDSPDCTRVCHKDLAYFVRHGMQASDKGHDDVLIRTSLQNQFRQSLIECITCQTAVIEIHMNCDIDDHTSYDNSELFTTQNGVPTYTQAPASKLIKHTLQNVFDTTHGSPYFFGHLQHDALDVPMALLDVAQYNTDVSRKQFPLPSSKVEIPVTAATSYTNTVLQNMQSLASLFKLDDNTTQSQQSHGDLEMKNVSGGSAVMNVQLYCSHRNDTSVQQQSSGGGGGKSLENNLEVCINDELQLSSLTPIVKEGSQFQDIRYIAKNKRERDIKTYDQPSTTSRVARVGQRRAHMDSASSGGAQWRSAQSKLYDDARFDYIDITKPSKLPLRGAYSQGMYDVVQSGGGGGSLDLQNNEYRETHGSEAVPTHRPASSVNALKKQTLRNLIECVAVGGSLLVTGSGALSYESRQELLHHQPTKNKTQVKQTPKVSSGFSFTLNLDSELLDDNPVSSLFAKNKAIVALEKVIKVSQLYEDHTTSPDFDITLPSPDLDSIHFQTHSGLRTEPLVLQQVLNTCTDTCMSTVEVYHKSMRYDPKLKHVTLPANALETASYNHYHYEPTISSEQRKVYADALTARKRFSHLGKLRDVGVQSSDTTHTQELFYAQCICPCIQRNLKNKQWISYLGCNNLAIGTRDRSTTGHVDIDTKSTSNNRQINAPRFKNRIHTG